MAKRVCSLRHIFINTHGAGDEGGEGGTGRGGGERKVAEQMYAWLDSPWLPDQKHY